MNLIILLASVVVSFVCMYFGAMYFIDGAAVIAKRLKVPSLIIALTIVAFGTSAPELFVGIMSSIKGVMDLSVGNLLGSSFADVSLVLGIAALIRPIHIKIDFLRQEFPFVLVACILLFLLSSDGILTWGDGIILIITFCVYIYYTLIVRMLEEKIKPSEERLETKELKEMRILDGVNFKKNVFYLVCGLIVLMLGAHWLTESATTLAHALNIPNFLIGVTLISIGTVLPELITGIVASMRGEEDIEVGNALGSLIFNILFLFGIFSVITPILIPHGLILFEIPALLSVGILLLPLMRRNFVLGRIEGALLVLLFVVYNLKQFFF